MWYTTPRGIFIMSKTFKFLIILLIFVFAAGNIVFAGGLSSHFVEAKLKRLSLGRTYSVKKMFGRSLDVLNTTEHEFVDIKVKAEKPVDNNLVPGYEPIPDLSWVKIEKDYFENIGPDRCIETDIFITIPKDRSHSGKKYQVYIYSYITGGGSFRVGIMSRILLEIK